MNKKDLLLEKLAKVAVEVGANVQKEQVLFVSSPIHAYPLARLIQKQAYIKGAKKVFINYYDSECTRNKYIYESVEALSELPDFELEKAKYMVDNNCCRISISSSNPFENEGVDMKNVMIANRIIGPKLAFLHDHFGASKSQWTIVAYPNDKWCQLVFPNLPLDEAWDKLFDEIMKASRINLDSDPKEQWDKHTKALESHAQLLNQYNFKTLHFKNSLGTDLTLELVENHLWAGGGEMGGNGVYFVPNIPTEEVFTMPHKDKVNGKVVATKPLNYNGNLIEDFYFVFKDGQVVDYNAKKGYDALKSLLELDEGSKRLGEVALISYDSPISKSNILFNDTLFDENASCHLALGNAYSMNIKNGTNMDNESLSKLGYNISIEHVDFMFGSDDLEVIGTTQDGKQVQIFTKGNFVF